ncbi:hypothetical protein C3L33_18035, partial [Rhododendron williamsianum]
MEIRARVSTDTIPQEFIRPENEQPGLTTYGGQARKVPIVDFSDPHEENLVRSIVDASSKWGMFQIVNHEIPGEAIRKLQEAGKEFFELPQEEKEAYAKPVGSKSVEGYGTKLQKEVEGKKGWVDHLFHKIWPPHAINYQEELKAPLGQRVGVPDEDQLLPTVPPPRLALGVVAHSDMCAITILVPNEVQGLQAFLDGCWYDVKYIPNALIIHIGDQIEILSNGKYKSVFHRSTLNKENTRMSWPVFLEPPSELELGPHPKLISEDNPPKYKTKKYSDYVYCKLNKIPQ